MKILLQTILSAKANKLKIQENWLNKKDSILDLLIYQTRIEKEVWLQMFCLTVNCTNFQVNKGFLSITKIVLQN